MQAIRRLTCLAAVAACAFGLSTASLAQGAGAPAAAPKAAAPGAAPVIVTLQTSAGPIVLELDAQHSPRTVANFVQYVKEGFYPGTIFHRVIPGFMIQGGGFTESQIEKPTHPPIAIESRNGLKNVRGSIAMARTMNPDSAAAQFYINLVDNAFLDYPGRDGYGYTVFGRVVEGMDVVDRIGASPTQNLGGAFINLPVPAVVIQKAKLGK
jgi:peptidyl-prolyl cis-trans isomerase A (cyclophilin A)